MRMLSVNFKPIRVFYIFLVFSFLVFVIFAFLSSQETKTYSSNQKKYLEAFKLQESDPMLAIDNLIEISKSQPKNAQLLSEIGTMSFNNGRYDQAYHYIQKAISIQPSLMSSTDLNFAYAASAFETKHLDVAESHVRLAIELLNDKQSAYYLSYQSLLSNIKNAKEGKINEKK